MKIVKKNKTTKPSLLLRPLFFLILGIITFLLFFITVLLSGHVNPFLNASIDEKFNLILTILLFESVIFFIYGIILKVIKLKHDRKISLQIFEILSMILIILFVYGLLSFILITIQAVPVIHPTRYCGEVICPD